MEPWFRISKDCSFRSCLREQLNAHPGKIQPTSLGTFCHASENCLDVIVRMSVLYTVFVCLGLRNKLAPLSYLCSGKNGV